MGGLILPGRPAGGGGHFFSQADFVFITNMRNHQIGNMVRTMTVTGALEWRRNIQRGIAEFRKTNDPRHPRLWRAVDISMMVERWLKKFFIPHRKKFYMRTEGLKPVSAKIKAKKEWEALVKRYSY